MNIAIVCQNYPPATFEGGISHYSALLAENLLNLGHEVYAFTSSEFTRPLEESRESDGVRIKRIQGPWNEAAVQTIKEIARERKIEALILQYAPACFSTSFRTRWAFSRMPCQKITGFHTLWGRNFDKLIGLLMLFGCHKIIATNSEIIALLEKHLPFLLKKTYWIPIGSNILPTNQHTQQKSGKTDQLFSYFGMLYPGKGLELILDILELLKDRGQCFSFKFIGGAIPEHSSYEKQFRINLQKKNLDGMVEYLGTIPEDEVSYWLSQSRFVFLPYSSGVSDRRGSLMAALVHGKAILTSPPVLPTHAFKNGINMIWPNDPSLSGYVTLIEKLLRDDEIIATLGKGAKELSCHFDWKKIAVDHALVIGHGQYRSKPIENPAVGGRPWL